MITLFFSYSHKDEDVRDELEVHLSALKKQGIISTWHDRRIGAGKDVDFEIDTRLETSDIILLLVSPYFIASDYCYDVEMKRALQRHEAGEARVIPVIVRDVSWHSAPFRELQALPKDGRAVTLWPNRDSAWRDVAEGIEEAIRELRGEQLARY